MRVFLGGTCNDSQWRDQLIPLLKIDYFNPVVPDWTEACYQEELNQRITCDYVLYVITPLMTGVYSIAEVVDDSNKRPAKTIFCVIEVDIDPDTDDEMVFFNPKTLKSLQATKRMVAKNGGLVCEGLKDIADFLNMHVRN